MKSVIATKDDVRARIHMLVEQYRETFNNIDTTVADVGAHIDRIEKYIFGSTHFEPAEMKDMLITLNSDQTALVNLLKKMTELHAKMGYLAK